MSAATPSHLRREAASRTIYQQTEDMVENIPFTMTLAN